MIFSSPQEFLDKLNNWFNGLISIPLLAVAYGYLEIFSGGLQGVYAFNDYVTGGIIIVLLSYSVFSTRSYKKEIASFSKNDLLTTRIESYFVASKQFYFKIFSVSLLAVVGIYLSGSIAFAGFYAFLLFLLSIYRPSLLTVANKLNLSGQERDLFLKENKISKID